MIKHHEFTFMVRSPYDIKRCFHHNCKNQGEWAVIVKDDRHITVIEYTNICEEHILQVFIDAACGNW